MTDLDLLVVGSGGAGLSAAVRAAATDPGLRIGVVTKAALSQSATQWAQGGVAAVLDASEAAVAGPPDSVALHQADTLAAGAGLCDTEAVAVLVREGPARVRDLARQGARFDRDHRGVWALAREGGHSTARVVHAGGAATGAEVESTLVEAARDTAAALWEGWFAADLLVEGGRCRGVVAFDPHGQRVDLRAKHTLMACGGAGQLFSVTTNPPQSTGDGVAMALRAGVAVADVEFMQFHPTGLHVPVTPRPLLSEAVRGEGAILRDLAGKRFVDELAPRDVVSAAMATRMAATGAEHLWLDATGVEDFARAFPTLAEAAAEAGLDPARDWLPVAPAAHYLCGGIVTDLDGATTLPGLWAAGEAACSGVHGANRLASNSLLDGMVFAARMVDAMYEGKDHAHATGAMATVLDSTLAGANHVGVTDIRSGTPVGWPELPDDAVKGREQLQRCLTTGAGVLRDAAGLAAAAAELDRIAPIPAVPPGTLPTDRRDAPADGDPTGLQLANIATVGRALVRAAQARLESRGCHRRADHPAPSDAYHRRFVQ